MLLAQPMYTIQDLGTLAAPNLSCTATAISPQGNITGFCNPPGESIFSLSPATTRGFIYTNGKMTDLGNPPSQAPIVPTGVNDSGVVVGAYVGISLLTGLSVQPFLCQNGAIQAFSGIPTNTVLFGLSNSGESAATQVTSGGTNFFTHSTPLQVTTGGTATNLTLTGGANQGAAFGISAGGDWVAGASATVSGDNLESADPILWKNGSAQVLTAASGFKYSSAVGVNDSGAAVGMAFTYNLDDVFPPDPNGAGMAAMFSQSGPTVLGALGGDVSSAAIAINNSGDIVGFSNSSMPDLTLFEARYLEACASNFHAFLYTNGKMYNLTQQVTNGSGWQLCFANAINDAGQIVGAGLINGAQHAFLLTPVAAPTPPQLNSVVGAGLSVPPVKNLSANGLFTLFGTGFAASGPGVGASNLVNNTLPTNLANTCVEGGGTRWPLIYVSATQINAVADPLSTSGSVPITVISNCDQTGQLASSAVNVNAAAETPQFLFDVQNPSGQNEVVAVDALTGAKIGPPGLIAGETFAPAKAGEILTVYCVGLGATSPAAAVGSLAPGAANVTAPYTLTVGGKKAAVSYAGLTPTYAGLYQINLTVPAGLAAGNQPIVLTVNGVETPTGAFLAVQ